MAWMVWIDETVRGVAISAQVAACRYRRRRRTSSNLVRMETGPVCRRSRQAGPASLWRTRNQAVALLCISPRSMPLCVRSKRPLSSERIVTSCPAASARSAPTVLCSLDRWTNGSNEYQLHRVLVRDLVQLGRWHISGHRIELLRRVRPGGVGVRVVALPRDVVDPDEVPQLYADRVGDEAGQEVLAENLARQLVAEVLAGPRVVHVVRAVDAGPGSTGSSRCRPRTGRSGCRGTP